MFILEPVVHETIWGGDKLKKFKTSTGKVGHLYLVSGHEHLSNIILNGDLRGMSLKDIFPTKKIEWHMGQYDEFPLTIALVDASLDLSIQVHPDDETALLLEHKKIGKKESWIFLEAPKYGWIYGGCTCGAISEIKKAIDENKVDKITSHFPVKKMDCVTVNAGTLHSMTSGSLVYEIEYGSDFTYRFFDFDRVDSVGNKRELHLEKALKSIKPDLIPETISVINHSWINVGFYELCYETNMTCYRNISDKVELITVIKGSGICDCVKITGGMSILLPPNEYISGVIFDEVIIARLT